MHLFDLGRISEACGALVMASTSEPPMPHPLFRPSIALLLSALSPLGANATATNPRTANNDALALQVALDRAGFSPGAIDGTLGRLTREAVKGFQEAHGLAPTGRVDAETKAALGETGPATQTPCAESEPNAAAHLMGLSVGAALGAPKLTP